MKAENSEKDYEKLYYKAMKENILLKNKTIPIDLTFHEIEFLKLILYQELIDISNDKPYYFDDEDDEEMEKLNIKKEADIVLKSMLNEKKELIENLIKKVIFEK